MSIVKVEGRRRSHFFGVFRREFVKMNIGDNRPHRAQPVLTKPVQPTAIPVGPGLPDEAPIRAVRVGDGMFR